jgi:cytochrome c biogenesis protein CcdA
VIILFELPCTGGPYLFVLGLLAQKMSLLSATPLLLLYNLFFILPLIVITLIIYQGFTSVEKVTEWKDRNIRRLHLVTGIVMLVLGIVVALRLV